MSDAPDRPDATPSGPSALALSLEDGALRRELGGPASEPGAAVAPVSTTHDAHLRFDGEGGEYFRLWAVNLLLTLLTLVVYSAWAKVRKARWFAQHTVLLVMWVLTWPFFAARMQLVVWSNTWLGRIRFRGDMLGARFWRLVAKQTLLTLLTCGLYWPYASVAIARYRVESLAVQSPQPFGEHEFHAGAVADQAALGDASADLFGLDIGW